jgi:hypothetical protein
VVETTAQLEVVDDHVRPVERRIRHSIRQDVIRTGNHTLVPPSARTYRRSKSRDQRIRPQTRAHPAFASHRNRNSIGSARTLADQRCLGDGGGTASNDVKGNESDEDDGDVERQNRVPSHLC